MTNAATAKPLKWQLGTYKLRNGEFAEILRMDEKYLYGKVDLGIKGGPLSSIWKVVDGHNDLGSSEWDIVELWRSERFDRENW